MACILGGLANTPVTIWKTTLGYSNRVSNNAINSWISRNNNRNNNLSYSAS